jgi:hypothetical protein
MSLIHQALAGIIIIHHFKRILHMVRAAPGGCGGKWHERLNMIRLGATASHCRCFTGDDGRRGKQNNSIVIIKDFVIIIIIMI